MPFTGRLSVGLCEGNVTLRGLIQEVLSEASMSVKFMEASTALGEDRVDLLVIDVDSDVAPSRIELLLKVCLASQTPVLLLGMENVHGSGLSILADYGLSESSLAFGWMARPFTGAEIVYQCRQLLGLSTEASVAFVAGYEDYDDDVDLPSITSRFDLDEPPTVELGLDYHHLVEEGLESARDYEEILNFELEEFANRNAAGGVLVGTVNERLIEERELENEIGHLAEPTSLLRTTSSEGHLLSETLAEASSSGVFGEEPSANRVRASVSVVARHRLGGGHSSVSAAGLSPEIVHSIVGTARMLAESWDRLGLAARTEDRADRLERILFALFKDGLQGAASVLSRIPSANGFSGNLQVLGLIELLHMLRERSLRGRLELCVGDQVFVLYIDSGTLEDIESLGGSTDSILLRILRKESMIDDATYDRLSSIGNSDDGLGAPLEMRLRIEKLVGDDDLRAARRLRARELFGGLFGERRGNYAFIQTLEESKQGWPSDGLRLNIDEMMLGLMRNGQIESKMPESDVMAGFILDPVRAGSIRSSVLTDSERELLLFFQAGETVRDAQKQFGNAGEDVAQVLSRLIRIELLKSHKVDVRRSLNRRRVQGTSPVMAVQSAGGQGVVSQVGVLKGGAAQNGSLAQSSHIELNFDLDAIVGPVHDPHQSPTAVSDWAIPIPEAPGSEGPISEVIESIDDDGLWDVLDVFFEHENMSDVSSELLPDTGELDQRLFGAGEQNEES